MKSTAPARRTGGRRLKMATAISLRRARSRQKWQPWRRDVVIKWTIALICAALAAITIYRGVARASDWALMRKLPGAEWQQRGPTLDQQTACLTALASDGFVVPPGTKLRCERVAPKETSR